MAKKGVNTPARKPLSKPPTVLDALLRAEELTHLREIQIDHHHEAKKQSLHTNLNVANNVSAGNAQHVDFLLKQMIGNNNIQCEISENHFPQGMEVKWIRTMLTLDALDTNSAHDNRNDLIAKSRNMTVNDADAQSSVLEQTKDQLAQSLKKIDDKFLDDIISQLSVSESRSLIVHLKNMHHTIEPMAIVLLKGNNGLWLGDPKMQRTFILSNNEMPALKKFLSVHLQQNHKDCTVGSIIKIYNKERSALEKKQSNETRKGPLLAHPHENNLKIIEKTEKPSQQNDPSDKNNNKPKPKN